MRQLWKDELGFIVSAELVVVSCILVLGLMVGLVSVRDQVVQELGDVGAAIAVLQQGYEWFSITSHTASIAGSQLTDTTDFCDEDPDPAGLFPAPLFIDFESMAGVPEDPGP